MLRSALPLLLLLLAEPACAQASAPAASPLLIYRCENARGEVTIRDSPCAAGEKQQSRSMQRPRDPAPAPAPAKPAPESIAPTQPPAPPVIVYRAPPRPMYECVSPDGEHYTSETSEGQARWVANWGYGYVWPRAGAGGPDRPPPPGSSRPPPDRPRPPGMGIGVVPMGGSWVRDECHMLPQDETCARLSDRRYAILRRYNSAMPSERRELDLEQRGIDARMANDCRNP